MKIVKFGNENSRYSLILEKHKNGKSIDNTITYYNSNELDDIKQSYKMVEECQNYHDYKKDDIQLKVKVFDYQTSKYIQIELESEVK